MIKWNIDGVFRGNFRYVGIGGILYDEYGNKLCLFLFYIGFKSVNKVEFIVMVMVLEIVVEERRFFNKEVLMEFDLIIVILWVSNLENL